MNRETLATFGGLILVGVVVVATFLYGNHQRQNQTGNTKDTQQQEQAKPQSQGGNGGGQVSKSQDDKQPQQQPAVKKPEQTDLQGSKPAPVTGGSDTQPTPPATNQPAVTETPRTGGSVVYLLGATIMLLSSIFYRRSRHRLQRTAARA